MARFDMQDKPRFKKSFSNQVSPNTPRFKKGKGSTPKSQKGKGTGRYVEKLIFAKCCRKHEGKCLASTGNFDGCCKSGHMKWDCPMIKD